MPSPSANVVDNFYWPDGSLLCFDLPPKDVTMGWSNTVTGGIYDIPNLFSKEWGGSFGGWSNWIDKHQKDYTFTALSDSNTIANLFPEVQSPWKFTEYVYQGAGKYNDLDTTGGLTIGIIRPPIVSPLRLDNSGSTPQFGFLNEKYTTFYNNESRPHYVSEYQWQSSASGKTYWDSELRLMQWQEPGYSGTTFSKTGQTRMYLDYSYPAPNTGVRMNRLTVWSRAARWGQSQNIPPRTISTTAPPDWLSPKVSYTGRIIPHVEVIVGAPIYDCVGKSVQGVIRYDGINLSSWSWAAKIGITPATLSGTDGVVGATFTYTVPADNSTAALCVLPAKPWTGTAAPAYQWMSMQYSTGDLVHRGCAFWKGTAGTCRCTYSGQGTPSPHHTMCAFNDGSTDPAKAYRTAGGLCPFYTSQGQQVVATYQVVAANGAEWANMQNGLPADYKQNPMDSDKGQALMGIGDAMGPLGLGSGMLIAYQFAAEVQTPNPYDAGVQTDEITTYKVTFEPESIAVPGKQLVYANGSTTPPANNPDDSLQVRAGTGLFPIDWETNAPYSGVDSVFFGSFNRINYRVTGNIQHCYRSDKCDAIILGDQSVAGWQRGRYSNINFTNHILRMPHYPAADGTDQYCHYGNRRCPHTNLDRRALEYRENYKVLLAEILQPFRLTGISAFPGLQEMFLVNGVVTPLNQSTWTNTAIAVAAMPDNGAPPLLGHWQPLVKDGSGQTWYIFFYYTKPSWDPAHTQSDVAAHLVQFDGNDQPCYIDSSKLSSADVAIMKLVDGGQYVPWLVQLYDDYHQPDGNLLCPTNGKAFAGGRNPEYRDQSKRGRAISCQMGGMDEVAGAEGSNASNQFGGQPGGRAAATDQNTITYWTQRYGEYILTGPSVPATAGGASNYVPVEIRIKNVPPVYGGAIPITGVPNSNLQDPDTPQTQFGDSDYATRGHVYSTDTPELLAWFQASAGLDDQGHPQTNWTAQLPVDPNSVIGAKITCYPPGCDTTMLPVNRNWYQCTNCGIDISEEEYNFFVAHQSYLAPLPQGATGGGTVGCPRQCGGTLIPKGAYNHFLETRARGEVDLWGPPGSTVHYDGFFWKNPTQVSRIHVDQLMQKLGSFKRAAGVYLMNSTPGTEVMGDLTRVTGSTAYVEGISHGLVAPLASAGSSIAAVRTSVTSLFNLQASDVPYYLPAGATTVQQIISTSEASTQLSVGDQLVFVRKGPGGDAAYQSLIMGVAQAASVGLLNETLVKNDPTRPVRSNYTNDPAGTALFNDAVRQWISGCVQDSSINWSTAADGRFPANAKQLEIQSWNLGLPAILANGIDPTTGNMVAVDERIIAPYDPGASGGLQMISLAKMKSLRNLVIPSLPYDLSSPTYTAGGDYTQMAQASNSNRYQTVTRPIPLMKYGCIPPQVMAATSTGQDAYVEWDIGDVLGTKARAYYPTGKAWWRLNQMVGQIKRSGGKNPLHLDDSTNQNSALLPYTGDTVTSGCVFFLHGRVPMHMEVVAAYVVYSTADGPSAAALGCVGQYDGNVEYENSQGVPLPATAHYQGNAYCYWQHYHSWSQPALHEGNWGGYGGPYNTHNGAGGSYWDINSKWHVDNLTLWSASLEAKASLQSDRAMPAPDDGSWSWPGTATLSLNQGGPNGYISWMLGDTQSEYLQHVNMLNVEYADESHGFTITQDFFAPWSWGTDLTQNYTEHEIWKDLTYAQYQDILNRYTTVIQASLDGDEAVQMSPYTAAEFRNQVYPNEQQGITGLMDFTNYDSYGAFDQGILVADKATDYSWSQGPQVIVQADGTGTQTGGLGTAGDVARVLDVTSIVRQEYDTRVARFYQCTLGKSWSDLVTQTQTITDTNIGQAARFHALAPGNGSYQPDHAWNYRVLMQGFGGVWDMWLNDPWHHMPTVDDTPVAIPATGDPLTQSTSDQQARVSTVTAWDTQGITDSSNNAYYTYHPRGLIASSDPSFGLGSAGNPMPAVSGYWRSVTDNNIAQSFDMDLRSTPLETMRRNWRYTQPQIDSSSATCPNVNGCFVAQKGWTVSQYYENAVKNFHSSAIPSIHSDRCANCGTKLVGVLYLNGDGITTVSYDPAWADNPFITQLQVSADATDGWKATLKHGFDIEAYNTTTNSWLPVVSVTYNTQTQQYSFPQWNGTTWVTITAATVPTLYGCQGVANQPRNPSQAVGCHFIIPAAAKIRYQVSNPASENATDTGTCSVNASGTAITIAGTLSEPAANYTGRAITLTNPTNQTTITVAIGNVVGQTVTFAGMVDPGYTQYSIAWTRYVCRCTKMLIAGQPYRVGDMVVTPPPRVQMSYRTTGNNLIQLQERITKILEVHVVAGNNNFDLTQVGDMSYLYWQMQPRSSSNANDSSGAGYDHITGGNYYYNVATNTLVLPSVYKQNPGDKGVPIDQLNTDLYSDATKKFYTPTIPTTITIQYFTGNGTSVDVPVVAAGVGPSYQLEPDSICFVAGFSGDNQTVPPYVITDSNALPGMGNATITTSTGDLIPLRWQVYNPQPIIWPATIGWLVGDELGASKWGSDDLLNLFSGNRGRDLSELGSGTVLAGKATGTVTITGLPNTILSGNLAVYAKATTSRTYHQADGTTTTLAERTGGFQGGAMVFNLTIAEDVSSGRKGVMCPVPSLLVYLRERSLDPSVDPV